MQTLCVDYIVYIQNDQPRCVLFGDRVRVTVDTLWITVPEEVAFGQINLWLDEH